MWVEPSFLTGKFISLLILLLLSELHILVEVIIKMHWIKLAVEQLVFWTGLDNVGIVCILGGHSYVQSLSDLNPSWLQQIGPHPF